MKIIKSFRQLSFSVGCNVEQNVHHLHVINMYLSRNLAELSSTAVLRGRNIRNFPYSTYRQIPMHIRQSRNIHKIEYNVILYLSANQTVFLARPSDLTLFYLSANIDFFSAHTSVWEKIYNIECSVNLYLSANLAVFLAYPSGGGRNKRDQT